MMVPSMPLVGAWSLEARWLFKFWWKDYMFLYDQVRKLTSSTQIIRNTYRSLKYFVLISNQHCIKRCIVSILIYVYQNYFDLLSALDRKIQCQHQRLGGGWTNAWIQVHSNSVQNVRNTNATTNINSVFEFLTDIRLLFVQWKHAVVWLHADDMIVLCFWQIHYTVWSSQKTFVMIMIINK